MATRKWKFGITQEDIDKSKMGDPQSCAIARRMRIAFGFYGKSYERNHGTVVVDGDVKVEYKGRTYDLTTNLQASQIVYDFIEKFDDDRKSAEPFSIELDVPEELIPLLEKAHQKLEAKRKREESQNVVEELLLKPKAYSLEDVLQAMEEEQIVEEVQVVETVFQTAGG